MALEKKGGGITQLNVIKYLSKTCVCVCVLVAVKWVWLHRRHTNEKDFLCLCVKKTPS